jgi:hypothetical protein
MSDRNHPAKLFVSYDMASRRVARDVIDQLKRAGAEVTDVGGFVSTGGEYSDQMREALRASDVFVTVITSSQLGANTLILLGAANSASKPMVILTAGVDSVDLPMHGVHLLPITRAEEIIDMALRAHAA